MSRIIKVVTGNSSLSILKHQVLCTTSQNNLRTLTFLLNKPQARQKEKFFKDYDVFLVWMSLCLSFLGFAQLLGPIGLCPSQNLSFQPVFL